MQVDDTCMHYPNIPHNPRQNFPQYCRSSNVVSVGVLMQLSSTHIILVSFKIIALKTTSTITRLTLRSLFNEWKQSFFVQRDLDQGQGRLAGSVR